MKTSYGFIVSILCCIVYMQVNAHAQTNLPQSEFENNVPGANSNNQEDVNQLNEALGNTVNTLNEVLEMLNGNAPETSAASGQPCQPGQPQKEFGGQDCIPSGQGAGTGFDIVDQDGDGLDDDVRKALDDLAKGTKSGGESAGNTKCKEDGTLEEQIACLQSPQDADEPVDVPGKGQDEELADEKNEQNKCGSGSLDSDINCLKTGGSDDPGLNQGFTEEGEMTSIPPDPSSGQPAPFSQPPQNLAGDVGQSNLTATPPKPYDGPPLDIPGSGPKELCVHVTRIGVKECVYYRDDSGYVQEGIERLNYLFRDDRQNQICQMDPRLYDLLWNMHYVAKNQGGNTDQYTKILSAYRTESTNSKVGGASSSKHMKCMAADWKYSTQRLTDCGKVYANDIMASNLGLGCYPNTNGHVHPPDGGPQHWPRGAWCDCLDGKGNCGGAKPSGCYSGG